MGFLHSIRRMETDAAVLSAVTPERRRRIYTRPTARLASFFLSFFLTLFSQPNLLLLFYLNAMSAPPNNPYQVGRDLPPRPNQRESDRPLRSLPLSPPPDLVRFTSTARTVIHGRNLNPDVVMKGGRQLPPVDPPHVFKSDQPGQLPSDARRATTRIGGRRKKHHGHEINR